VLLPLRAFLGFTFTFAGLQKLANPGFFDASNPASIQAQLAAAARLSPAHALLAHVVHLAVPIGVVIALAEIGIGLGTLLGLWARMAALGGLVLSFSLFLTVSFHSSPYYTGADIVFVFAWMPMIVAGAGGVLSADALIARHVRARRGVPPQIVVSAPFAAVQTACGCFDAGRCRAMDGAPCEPGPCPYLRQPPTTLGAPGTDEIDRRTFAVKGAVAAAVAGLGLLGAGLASAIGRIAGTGANKSSEPSLPPSGAGPTTSPSAATSGPGGSTSTPTPAGTRIGPAADVPVGGSASFQDPSSGDPSLVIQPAAGTFLAFDAVCPHAGCIVGYQAAQGKFACPCHGSQFNGQTGAVERGPAPRGLTRITVAEGADGELYAT